MFRLWTYLKAKDYERMNEQFVIFNGKIAWKENKLYFKHDFGVYLDCLQSVKDNCNPVYDETFEYIISQAELNGRQLEVTVLSQKTWKSPVMGQVMRLLSC